jgi:hypothetical protein
MASHYLNVARLDRLQSKIFRPVRTTSESAQVEIFFATQMTGRRNGECEPLVSELKNWQRPIP